MRVSRTMIPGAGWGRTSMRLALLLLSIVALGAACRDPAASKSTPAAPEAERRDPAPAVEEVKLARPEYRSRVTTLETTGRVVFNEERLVRITAPVTGRVVEVLVRPGDLVEPGHRLLVLDSPDAGLARADYAKATADAERAEHALRLARDLFEVRAVAQKEVRDAESEYRKTAAERDRAPSRASRTKPPQSNWQHSAVATRPPYRTLAGD